MIARVASLALAMVLFHGTANAIFCSSDCLSSIDKADAGQASGTPAIEILTVGGSQYSDQIANPQRQRLKNARKIAHALINAALLREPTAANSQLSRLNLLLDPTRAEFRERFEDFWASNASVKVLYFTGESMVSKGGPMNLLFSDTKKMHEEEKAGVVPISICGVVGTDWLIYEMRTSSGLTLLLFDGPRSEIEWHPLQKLDVKPECNNSSGLPSTIRTPGDGEVIVVYSTHQGGTAWGSNDGTFAGALATVVGDGCDDVVTMMQRVRASVFASSGGQDRVEIEAHPYRPRYLFGGCASGSKGP